MYDIIGKRRWFFLISALVTIPGLIFILLTPLTGGKEGLQFTIDYTGGTTWQIRFQDPNVTAAQVANVFKANDLQAVVVHQDNGFMDIKTEGVGLRHFVGAACLCGVADTMALLMADRAFTTHEAAVAKVAVLVGSALAGVLGAFVLRNRRPARTPG